MTQIPAHSHSFTEWRRAADKLLKLQTSLSRSRAAPVANGSPTVAQLEVSVANMGKISDRLFQVAFAEVTHDRVRLQRAPSVRPGAGRS